MLAFIIRQEANLCAFATFFTFVKLCKCCALHTCPKTARTAEPSDRRTAFAGKCATEAFLAASVRARMQSQSCAGICTLCRA